MIPTAAPLLLALVAALPPGDHTRMLTVERHERSYIVHVPPQYDHSQPTPVVLVLHGAAANAVVNVRFTGMSSKADEAGFIAVYPNGTGAGRWLRWNAGLFIRQAGRGLPDDVLFINRLLDDLDTVVHVDPDRVYATGMSNGGMMCYRLAAELSDRIAAIAPVAGTMAIDDPDPPRPVPVMHFHGTADSIVPATGPAANTPAFLTFKSVEATLRAWRRVNGCPDEPQVVDEPDAAPDGTRVKRTTWGPGRDGSEVVYVEIAGGGHTWPGRKPPVAFLGKSTFDISANDLIWEFFEKHPMKGGVESAE